VTLPRRREHLESKKRRCWRHAVATRSYVNDEVILYLDSQRIASRASPNVPAVYGSSILTLGGSSNVGADAFLGEISELAIYSRALSSSEVLEHYSMGKCKRSHCP
jgi:hypothetical protein